MDDERQDEKAKKSLLKDMAREGISKKIKGLPLKVKLIIAGIVLLAFLFIILFVTILTPLMMLLLFDDSDGDTAVSDSNLSYVEVNSVGNYWWPVGSATIEMKDNIEYATGTPTSVRITSMFDLSRIICPDDNCNPNHDDCKCDSSPHSGLDIGPSSNDVDYVIASVGGKVVQVNNTCSNNGKFLDGNESNCGGGYGNYIKIQNGSNYFVYAHLYPDSIRVKRDDVVNQGQIIAEMGNSGNTTGKHLHFQIEINGYGSSFAKDPLGYVDPNNPRPVS